MELENIDFWQFSEGKWMACTKVDHKERIPYNTIKIATFNVLHGLPKLMSYAPNTVQSNTRFEKIIETLKGLDAHIITLNEATSDFVNMISREDWVRSEYYLSGPPDTDAPPSWRSQGYGNFVLTKICPKQMQVLEIPGLSRDIIITKLPLSFTEEKSESDLFVAASHLTALSRNDKRRHSQLKDIYQKLDELLAEESESKSTPNLLILGDLNFHKLSEDTFIRDDYQDIWKVHRPDDPGFTWDSHKNSMIQHIYPLGFESRQMRLDRILLKPSTLKSTSVNIFGDEPIFPEESKKNEKGSIRSVGWKATPYSEVGLRIVEQIYDLFSVNYCREPKEYLFMSDHFGIVAEFEFCEQ